MRSQGKGAAGEGRERERGGRGRLAAPYGLFAIAKWRCRGRLAFVFKSKTFFCSSHPVPPLPSFSPFSSPFSPFSALSIAFPRSLSLFSRDRHVVTLSTQAFSCCTHNSSSLIPGQ